ncbi:cobalamin biosynthesis protein [Salipiger sp. P9]|uniref:cobalamin biosynthesis protein n=1 Tax=Salipiger pentaromativorans TaxID=2943193 RepID=UPI002157FB72|nr:cobalamin biosynthesis protein [Salipiger pentaromativorans]
MIVAGFGFRGAATPESLRDAYDLARAGNTATRIATAADKAESPAFRAFAQSFGLPVVPVPPQHLTHQATLTRSAASQTARGTGSVAEAAALAAAGPQARLLGARAISKDRLATCALAWGETT